jgi:hypothetical protein
LCRSACEDATLGGVYELSFRIIRVVERRADATPVLHEAGEAVLVSRGYDRLLVMRCPCGCGEDIIVNLDRAAGPAWVLYRHRRGASLFPSVWRVSGCGSHFVVWNDRILLFSGAWRWSENACEWDRDVDERVLAFIRDHAGAVGFRELAEQLQEIPWSVLAACRRLSSAGTLVEVDEGVFEPSPGGC